jgi:hypothetical protein
MDAPRKTTRNAAKAKRPTTHAKRTETAQAAKAPRGRMKNLTPDGLRRLWRLHHPELPEIRASLERLFRRGY